MAASFTQAQLDTLEDAIAQGALRVRYSDKEIIYRSLEEMLQIRNMMRKSLKIAKGEKVIFTEFSKGT